jgi:choline monooxygenase
MSDLSISLEALERSRSQLSVPPTSTRICSAANRHSSSIGPRYLGHELAVPEVGDYLALAQEGEGRALVRTARAWSWSPTSAGTARR